MFIMIKLITALVVVLASLSSVTPLVKVNSDESNSAQKPVFHDRS